MEKLWAVEIDEIINTSFYKKKDASIKMNQRDSVAPKQMCLVRYSLQFSRADICKTSQSKNHQVTKNKWHNIAVKW
jgi:hypothetical protein